MPKNTVRVRFAPSPTGPLHIGGVRTALYNYLFAKKHNGTFILRIEDTDRSRFVPGAQDYILSALSWCGISPDEGPGFKGGVGPYIQSERKDLYFPFADLLINKKHAYYAFDTPEELKQMREKAREQGMPNWQYNNTTRGSMQNSLSLSKDIVEKKLLSGEPYVVRMMVPRNAEIRFYDEVRGWVVVNSNNIDDKVLFKSDGLPTYHLANIVDDHKMKITHVIRGEEWLPSAPLHVLLYDSFGWERPKFAHLPLLLKPDGNGKLSKRDGDRLGFPVFPLNWKTKEGVGFSGYKEQGYFSSAFINMLAFLGWNPGTTQEIFSLKELCDSFSLERVSKSGAKFDPEKTKWFQEQHLRQKKNRFLAEKLQPLLNKSFPLEDLSVVCGLMKERATFLFDIWKEGSFLLVRPEVFDEKTVRKKWTLGANQLMSLWLKELSEISVFSANNIESCFSSFLSKNTLKMGQALPLFRLLLTGKGVGPNMFEVASFLGKKECVERILFGLEKLDKNTL